MKLGTTYSHRHINYLTLSVEDSFKTLLDLKFDLIRLGVYWDEVQKDPDTYDFSKIASLLDLCEEKGQKTIVTIGMKAPRLPEYYFPSWISNHSFEALTPYIFSLLGKTVEHLKHYHCIAYWQVENEPLDPSGPPYNYAIPPYFLDYEVSFVRDLDPTRPVVVTFWGNEIKQRNKLRFTPKNADIVGWDIYYSIGGPDNIFYAPQTTDEEFLSIRNTLTKPFWITELQAEPWEHNELFSSKKTPISISIQKLQDNIKRAKKLHPEVLLFWGYEYWYWKKVNGDNSYIQYIKDFLSS